MHMGKPQISTSSKGISINLKEIILILSKNANANFKSRTLC